MNLGNNHINSDNNDDINDDDNDDNGRTTMPVETMNDVSVGSNNTSSGLYGLAHLPQDRSVYDVNIKDLFSAKYRKRVIKPKKGKGSFKRKKN